MSAHLEEKEGTKGKLLRKQKQQSTAYYLLILNTM